MSRIGKKPIQIPSNVEVKLEGKKITAKGPKGELFFVADNEINFNIQDGMVIVNPINKSNKALSKWGMSRTILANILKGVQEGYERKLEVSGVGYRASISGSSLNLSLGFSHEVLYHPPEGINISVPKPTEILIFGIDKQKVNQVAAEVRRYRRPDPYKGKGIRRVNEVIVRKEGKKK
ncbi:50S ribosomal protein L6 [Liberibacter crescens]|nr:50S ribosomal protein L6 [Liberibacter crescens]AMC12600.1 50S ribosomal protein L6 [Liberibacter crescens]